MLTHSRTASSSPGNHLGPQDGASSTTQTSQFNLWDWTKGSVFSTCFSDESCPVNPSLGHTLSFRSHNNREITFSYLDTVSSFLFISHSFPPVFSLKWSCYALGQSSVKEEQRCLVSWGNQKNLLQFQNVIQAASSEQALHAPLGWVHARETETFLPWAEALKRWGWWCKYSDSVVNSVFSWFFLLLFISYYNSCISFHSLYIPLHVRAPAHTHTLTFSLSLLYI